MIQPHGWLLVLDRDTGRIVQASANIAELTGRAAADCLGLTVAELLGPPVADPLARAMLGAGDSVGPFDCRLPCGDRPRELWGLGHRQPTGLLLELVPNENPANTGPLLAGLCGAVRSYRSSPGIDTLLRAAVADLRRTIGYERALAIRFDRQGNALMVVEDSAVSAGSMLGERVAATLIPAESRAHWETTRLCAVPDVLEATVPLVPALNPLTGQPPDMTRLALRPGSPGLSAYVQERGVRAVLLVSLMSGGRLWGLLAGFDPQPRRLSPSVCALAEALGEIAAAQISVMEERASAGARLAASRSIERLTAALRANHDLAAAVEERRDDLHILFAPDAWVAYIDGEMRSEGTPPSPGWLMEMLERTDVERRDGVVAACEPEAPGDYRAVLRIEAAPDAWLLILRRSPEPWTAGELDSAQELHRLMVERHAELYRVRTEMRLHRLAFYDPVTELPNRSFLLQDLQRALAVGEDPALLIISLDRYKTLAGSLGFTAADRLVAAVARRLEGCLGPGDKLARVDGGEFAVLVPAARGAEGAGLISHAVREALRNPVEVEGREVFVTASLGVVSSAQAHGLPMEVLRNAEIAALEAESSGGGTRSFEAAMRARLTERYDLYDRLRRAVYFSGGIRTAYQPIVDLADGRLLGFEVLARWQDPDRGEISPSEFIPIAEETGLIVPLGNQILMQGCRQIGRWNKLRPDCPLYVSVNLSPYQMDPGRIDLARWVRGVLELTGADPSWVKLEITESGLIANASNAVEVLHRLRDLGVGLAIDDFGTGYSSLSYLQRLPVESIKIDRSFIAGMGESVQGTELVRTIVQLARILGFSVVAEGIETPDQLEQVRALGCGRGQGFHFAKPLTPWEAEALVQGAAPWTGPLDALSAEAACVDAPGLGGRLARA
ncbi:EAL domain-containing protein [Rhodocista pekingensis]|uniref:EAL domain-containing protein n=1 Tax=Rhodocista pekingensis TaxID=201185 RepID=A0ABW2KTQ2_9PROT